MDVRVHEFTNGAIDSTMSLNQRFTLKGGTHHENIEVALAGLRASVAGV